MAKGMFLVVVAPSGAGKTTLIGRIRDRFPDLAYSISCTTRAPRPGEVDGKHYYFVTKEGFEKMVAEDGFLEWKQVHGNLYGTPAEPARRALETGKRMVLDIDVEGAKEVFRQIPEAVGVFVGPPDMETLEKRLRGRGTDSEEVIALRLENARKELEAAPLFQYHVINDDLDRAVEELANIIENVSTRGSGC